MRNCSKAVEKMFGKQWQLFFWGSKQEQILPLFNGREYVKEYSVFCIWLYNY